MTVILNEASGGAGGGRAEALEQQIAASGLGARFERVNDGAGVAERAAGAAARRDVLVAAGGDGTVSAAAAAAVGAGLTFGVIPLGTLNHFARDAGIPLEPERAIAAIVRGRVRGLDVGEVNGHQFVNNASLGMYPRMVWEREAEQRRGRAKWMAFAIATFKTWMRYRTVTVRMSVDGQEYVRRTPIVFIGNGEYQVEGPGLGRRASLDGGALWIYVTPPSGRFDILALPLRALAGRLTQDAGLESLRASAVSIEAAPARVRLALDGEVAVVLPPLRFRIRPRALSTIVGEPA